MPKDVIGSFREAIARITGQVKEKRELVIPETPAGQDASPFTRITIEQGPGFDSLLEMRGGKRLSGFSVSPAVGAGLGGEAAEGSTRGLDVARLLARASGHFIRRQDVAGENITGSETAMNGRVELKAVGVTGVGTVDMSPSPGTRMVIGVGFAGSPPTRKQR